MPKIMKKDANKENKVRLGGNGPYVPPHIAKDLKKRAKQNGSSLGLEIEVDWELARDFRAQIRNTPSSK